MRSTRKTLKVPRNAATMHQLSGWFRAMYEKLGWMVLAKAKGLNSKVAEYKKNVAHLVSSIEHVKSEYTDMNRIHDLNVLHMEANVLLKYVNKHF